MWSDPVCPKDHSGNCGEDQDGGRVSGNPSYSHMLGSEGGGTV